MSFASVRRDEDAKTNAACVLVCARRNDAVDDNNNNNMNYDRRVRQKESFRAYVLIFSSLK